MFRLFDKINNDEVYVIAEMSANHGGSLENALEIVRQVAETGADCLKIQTYTADSMTIDCDNDYFKIKGSLWDGYRLYDLYIDAGTPYEWQAEIKKECEKYGLDFLSTPFDKDAVDFLEDLEVEAYKIASFELVDIPLIEYTASKGKPMIISCGMASLEEITDALNACNKMGNDQVVLLKCCSEYPANWADMHLGDIPEWKKRFGVNIGLSDHSAGSIGAVVGVSLGACVVEKHVKLDGVESADSKFSMSMQEFTDMVNDIRNAKVISGASNFQLTEGEQKSKVFRRSIFAVSEIKAGDTFTEESIRVIRPSDGLSPKYYGDLLGKVAKRDISRGTPLCMEDLDGDVEKEEFSLRLACEKDIDLLFVWANDSQVRKNAFHTEPIPYEKHKEWFSNLLKDDSRMQYIFMQGEKSVGQIRFSINGEGAEIDYSISPEMRGKGYGKIMLQMAKEELHKTHPQIKKLIGQVKKGNEASKTCFENSGYDEVYTQFEISYEE